MLSFVSNVSLLLIAADRGGPLYGIFVGLKNESIIWGNAKRVLSSEPAVVHEAWEAEYGHVYTYRSIFSGRRLCTTDPRAISHVFANANDYPKPYSADAKSGIGAILGNGLLFVTGENHKRQRRIMSPSFSTPHLRELTSIFFEKSVLLCDRLLQNIAATPSADGYVTDVLQWLSHATLDIIGEAGFDYQFNALDNPGENAFASAVTEVLRDAQVITAFKTAQYFFPILHNVPDWSKDAQHTRSATENMARIGTQLVEDKKKAVLARAHYESPGGIQESAVGKDLLSALIRANIGEDIKESQKMSDKEVLSQIATFLIAGHETTATAVTWCLYALATHSSVQNKLRSELLSVSTPSLSMEDLNALPYLDSVVRETLRIHPPVSNVTRSAKDDGIIPVGEPYVDRWGNTQHTIRVTKGDAIVVPVQVMARSKRIWGEDAHEFRPERWDAPLPEAVREMPGVFSYLPTFLSGPRSCIGYKFAVIEMKAILFTLLRNIEFELANPGAKIKEKIIVVTKPFVESEPDKVQLPLRLKAL